MRRSVIKNNRCEIITKFYSIVFLGFALIFYLASIGSLFASALVRSAEPVDDNVPRTVTRSQASLEMAEEHFATGAYLMCGRRLWDCMSIKCPAVEQDVVANQALALLLASGQCTVLEDDIGDVNIILTLSHPTSPKQYAGDHLKLVYPDAVASVKFNAGLFFEYLGQSRDPVNGDVALGNRTRTLAGCILRSQGHGPRGRYTLTPTESDVALREITAMAANHSFSPAMAFLAQAHAQQGDTVAALYWDDLRNKKHRDHDSGVLIDDSRDQLQKVYSSRFYITLGILTTIIGYTGSVLASYYTKGDPHEAGQGMQLGAESASALFTLAQLFAPELALVGVVLCLSPLAMPKTPPRLRGTDEGTCCECCKC